MNTAPHLTEETSKVKKQKTKKDILAGSIKLTVIPFAVPETKGNFEVIRIAMCEEENLLKRNLVI